MGKETIKHSKMHILIQFNSPPDVDDRVDRKREKR